MTCLPLSPLPGVREVLGALSLLRLSQARGREILLG